MNVKKTKSLPLGYESIGGVSLSLGTSIVAPPPPQQNVKSTSTSAAAAINGKEAPNGTAPRNGKGHGGEKSSGKGGKTADRSAREQHTTGKENGTAFGDHGGKVSLLRFSSLIDVP